jgi:hypothetical protein
MLPDDNDDKSYTYNELSNEDRELLLENGYKPGELEPEDERQLIEDLRAQRSDDSDDDADNEGVIGDERDGTDSL